MRHTCFASIVALGLCWLAGPALGGDNELTAEEKKAGWKLLFNGVDHTGWKCNNGKSVAAPVENGSLVPFKSGGYLIVHEKQFGDFALQCDVKMSEKRCNSGIFFRVGDLRKVVQTGLEVQIYKGGRDYHDFGAIYDLVRPAKDVVKPAGQWNHVVITCKGPEITVEVNGQLVCEMDCDEFDRPYRRPDHTKHKFGKAIKDFPRVGYLGFQDHGAKVWFKNIKIREL